MSRTYDQILQTLIDAQAAVPELAVLNSPSQVSNHLLWKQITARAMYYFENYEDQFKLEVENVIANQPVGTVKWVQQKVFEFQYDSVTPQIVQLVDFVPMYNPIDVSKRIVTRSSVKTLPNKIVSIKVAKQEPPTPLTSPELTSLQGYLNDISFAGVQYSVTSTPPDYFFLEAEIKFNGQYQSTISATTIAAIDNYLATLPFDGNVKLISLVDAIQQVPGVTDVILTNVALRPNGTPFANTVYLVNNKTEIFSKYGLFSGYAIEETAPNDLASKLTFTAE